MRKEEKIKIFEQRVKKIRKDPFPKNEEFRNIRKTNQLLNLLEELNPNMLVPCANSGKNCVFEEEKPYQSLISLSVAILSAARYSVPLCSMCEEKGGQHYSGDLPYNKVEEVARRWMYTQKLKVD